jgi:hypothetical protein
MAHSRLIRPAAAERACLVQAEESRMADHIARTEGQREMSKQSA